MRPHLSSTNGWRFAQRAAAAALLVATAAAQDADRVFTVRAVDFDDAAIVAGASAAAEAVWPEISALLGVEAPDAGELVVHLYRDPAHFEEAERARTRGRFAENRAFSFRGDLTAHIVCEPFWSEPTRRRLGISAQTRRLVVHEAAHLAVYASCKGRAAFHPSWLSEGLSQHIEEQVLRKLGAVDDPADNPWDAQAMVQVQTLLADGKLPTVEAILDDDLGSLGFYDRYAVQQAFFGMLASRHRRALRNVLAQLPEWRSVPRLKGDVGDRLLELLGRAARRRLDGDLREFVEGLEPRWRQPLRSLVAVGNGAWLQASLGSKNAVAFRRAPAAADAWPLRFRCELIECVEAGGALGVPQLNVLLDEGPDGFVSVALHGAGRVTVFAYARATDSWEKLGAAPAPIEVGKAVECAVGLDGEWLVVEIDGREVLRVEVAGRSWDGPWGIGAQKGTVGLWTSLPGVE